MKSDQQEGALLTAMMAVDDDARIDGLKRLTDTVRAVRKEVGELPVIAKINSEDGVEGGVTHYDTVFFAEQLVKAGIDGLEISGGSPGPVVCRKDE